MNSENSKKNTIKSKKHLTNSSKNSNLFDEEENSNESSVRKLFRKKTKKSTNKDKIEEENFENETNKINNKPLLTEINSQEKTKAKIKKNLQSFEPIIVEHKSEMKPMIKIPKRFIAKKKKHKIYNNFYISKKSIYYK